MNHLILNINYFFNIFIFFGFVVSFKKISKQTLSQIVLISLLTSTVITYILFRSLIAKNLFMFIVSALTGYFLLDRTMKDIVVQFIVFLSIGCINELLVTPLYSGYMQNGIFHMVWWAHILLSVCLNIGLFIMLKAHVYFMNSMAFLKKEYFFSFFTLLLLIFISSLLGTLFSLDFYEYYEYFDFVPVFFIFVLFTIWIILLITLIIIFIRQYYDEKDRLMMNELPATYQQVLKKISLKDQQDYARIQHDILNYIQIYKTIDDNERKDH